MPRQNDPVLHHVDGSFWEYAEMMDDGRRRCTFCGHEFAKGTSISRIKVHLAGVKGRGVRICEQVPQDVQEAALAAIDGPPKKKFKNGAGSSNNEVNNAISASAQQQRNEMMMAHQQEDLSHEDRMETLQTGSFHERPSFNQANEPRGDPSQPTNDQLCSPSLNNDVSVNDAQNVVGVRTEPVVQVLEQSNAKRDNLSVDAGRTQMGVQGMEQGREEGRVCSHLDMENTGEGSVQHVDRIVPPTIDDNYNRREATEILVQPGVGAGSFGVYGNHNAISTSQQEQKNEVDNVAGDAGMTPAAATMGHAPGRSLEELSRWLMEDDIENGTGGVQQPGAGASSSGGLGHNPKPLVKMLRKNDPVLHHVDRCFWEYAEKMDGGRMSCKFCGQLFAKDSSITRIKFHLAGVKGRGVRVCGQVPQDVQDAALAAIDGPPEKKLKTGVGSSNNEVTNAISASAQEQNNVDMAQQREDLSLEDWMASFHERPSFNQADEPRGDPSQPTNDQLCSPSVNNDVSVNDAQNVVGVRTKPVVQVLEQSNAELDNLSVDAGKTQVGLQGMEQGGVEGRVCSHLDMENTGEGSVQHVDRIVPPTIDENYNRREATERLVQPGIGASSFGVCGNRNAISTSQQEQNNEGENVAGDAGTTPETATMGHAPGRSLEEVMRSFEVCLMEDDNGTGGVARPGAGASSSGGLRHNPSENRGAPLLTGSTRLVGQAFEENRDVIWSWLTDDEVSTIGIYGMGGAGKTTMVKHIYNKLLQSPDIC